MKTDPVKILTKELLSDFPDFVREMQPDDIQPFMLFGDFGIYLRDGIENDSFDELQLQKIFNFLNKIGESTNDEVHNLLTVGVFEILTDSEKVVKMAKLKLKGDALKDFEMIKIYWYDDNG